jgi:hypothetical protein
VGGRDWLVDDGRRRRDISWVHTVFILEHSSLLV